MRHCLARLSILFLGLILSACETHSSAIIHTVSSYSGSEWGKSLTGLIKRMEKGDLDAWYKFSSYLKSKNLDGENSQIYSVACEELLRRDPTFLLRRHLAGDLRAVLCGQRAYAWAGHQGRRLLDQVYSRRLELEDSPERKEQIISFISQMTATPL